MAKYIIKYQKKLLTGNSEPHGDYRFSVSASSLEEAAKKAVPELLREGFLSDLHDIWNATVISTEKGPEQHYEILKNGGWLIDFETGKLSKSLEDKV